MDTRREIQIPDPHVPADRERTRLQKKKRHGSVTEDASADRRKFNLTTQVVR
jgi:hypothetical protein